MNAVALRALGFLLVIFGISLITFTLNHFVPGDKATIIAHALYPDTMGFPEALLEGIREEYHLEEPFLAQYAYWMSGILRGDFGVSYTSRVPVWDIFVANLGETVSLPLTSLGLGLLGAFILASFAVHHPGTLVDRFAVFLASLGPPYRAIGWPFC